MTPDPSTENIDFKVNCDLATTTSLSDQDWLLLEGLKIKLGLTPEGITLARLVSAYWAAVNNSWQSLEEIVQEKRKTTLQKLKETPSRCYSWSSPVDILDHA